MGTSGDEMDLRRVSGKAGLREAKETEGRDLIQGRKSTE